MSDEMQAMEGSGDGHGPICPWCSAALPDPEATRCPSCGAALHESGPADVPGVTQVDIEAVLKRRPVAQRSRGLIGWLSGEYQPESPPELHQTLAPPPDEVRREMLRLELAALEAEAEARRGELAALVADAGLPPLESPGAADEGPAASATEGAEEPPRV